MASLYPKKISGKTYWYLREMARVDGKPKMVSERYPGTAAEIAAAMEASQAAMLPERTRHLAFGDGAAAWGMLQDLGVAAIIDEVTGSRPAGLRLSAGACLALAALNRLAAPCSKLAFADWWKTTAGDRFTRIPASALDHRRFRDAMHAVTLEQLEEISRRIAVRIVAASGLDCSSVALDMTSFATFTGTGNEKAPVAQRGKARQKRSDLRLVGLGLVVTRDGGIPLTWHAYPGDRPDVTQFATMISQLRDQYEAIADGAGGDAAGMTVVFDAGQNSEDNFAHLAGTGLHYVGSVPASDCPDLTSLPASVRVLVDQARFGELTAYDTRRVVYGTERRAILPHSPPRATQNPAPGLGGHPPGQGGAEAGRAGRRPRPRQDPPAPGQGRGRDRRDHQEALGAAGGDLAAHRRAAQRPAPDLGHRLRCPRCPGRGAVRQARAHHRSRRMAGRRGDRGLPVPVRGRVLLPADERPPRRLLQPDAHWTEHNIRVHVFTCVLALQIAHLMRREAGRAGLHLSVRELLSQLAGIGETMLISPSTGGRPRARRMTTEHAGDQEKLYEIFDLGRQAPRS